MYLDSENGAVATLLRNDDLHSENISVDENFRVVSFILKFMLNICIKSKAISNLKNLANFSYS
jgi:hypothetical protein